MLNVFEEAKQVISMVENMKSIFSIYVHSEDFRISLLIVEELLGQSKLIFKTTGLYTNGVYSFSELKATFQCIKKIFLIQCF